MNHIAEDIVQSALSLGTKPKNAPCLNCENRKVTENYNCHSDCEAYLEYNGYRENVRLLKQEQMATQTGSVNLGGGYKNGIHRQRR